MQHDIKKVLAYSTISQLGYMVMALGAGAWTAAVFHLFTHAFFKALLFLGAGSVSHSGSHHSFDMKKDMGGLRKYMPITFWTFIIGSLALAGIFPFAGFWSKDEILVTAGKSGYDAFLVVGLVGAFLTAAYMTRCVYLTFFGEYRGHGHPHESEPRDHGPADRPRRSSRSLAGFLNAAPFGIEKFKEWVEPTVALPAARARRLRLPEGGHLGGDRGARASASPRTSGSSAKSSDRSEGSHASATSCARRATRSSRTSTTSTSSTRTSSSPAIKGPIAARCVLGQPARHRRRRQRCRAGSTVARAIHLRRRSTSRSSTARSTASPRSPARAAALLRYVQSGRVQRYALLLFARGGAPEPRRCSLANILIRGESTTMDWFDDWALTLAVFIPLVGMAIVLLIPKAEESADQGGRAADHAR